MKRLAVCCDGTWNTPELDSPTNVVRLAQAIRPRSDDGRPQIVYYDEGVGTHGPVDRLIGGAMGAGLDLNVRQAYRFIAGNYEDGDEIYLFGFSRGAYTVRSLAGMIGVAGLLGRRHMTLIDEAYELYREQKNAAGPPAQRFRADNNVDVPRITLLGCWDTVGALGIPDKLPGIGLDRRFNKRYRWLNDNLGAHVLHALHALAIDERRREFRPTRMHGATPGQTLDEVWFPGDHGSVGGGEPHKEPLSRIALQWMVQRIEELGLGLAIDTEFDNLAPRDHNIYFSRNRSPIYSRAARDLGASPRFHESALQRYLDLPHYAGSLSPGQRNLLKAACTQQGVPGKLQIPASRIALEPGQVADAVVHAEKQRNDTGIRLESGGVYRLAVAETQCWRDGDIPPCGAAGWSTNHPALARTFRRLNRIKKPLIRMGRGRRVVAEADWFELIGVLRRSDGGEEKFRIGQGTTYTAPFDGRLFALANDIASRIDLLDTYDNNEGWLVLNIARIE